MGRIQYNAVAFRFVIAYHHEIGRFFLRDSLSACLVYHHMHTEARVGQFLETS